MSRCYHVKYFQKFPFRLILEKKYKAYGLHQYYAIVQLIGTREEADKFAYKYGYLLHFYLIDRIQKMCQF